MGPIERELREADGEIGQLPFTSRARGLLFWAAEVNGLENEFLTSWMGISVNVDPDVFSYAIEAAEYLGL